jgi:hypothetical protein
LLGDSPSGICLGVRHIEAQSPDVDLSTTTSYREELRASDLGKVIIGKSYIDRTILVYIGVPAMQED